MKIKYLSMLVISALLYAPEANSSQNTVGLLTKRDFNNTMAPVTSGVPMIVDTMGERDLGWRLARPFRIELPKLFNITNDSLYEEHSWPEWLDLLFEIISENSRYNPTNISRVKEMAVRIGMVPYWVAKSFDTSSNSGSGYRNSDKAESQEVLCLGGSAGGNSGSMLSSPAGSGVNATNFGDWDVYYSVLENRAGKQYLNNRIKLNGFANHHDLFPAYYFRGDNFTNVNPINELKRDGFIAYVPRESVYSHPIIRYEMDLTTQLPKASGYVNAPLMVRELIRFRDDCGLHQKQATYLDESVSDHSAVIGPHDGDDDFIEVISGSVSESGEVLTILNPNTAVISKYGHDIPCRIIDGLIKEGVRLHGTQSAVSETAVLSQARLTERTLYK